MLLALDVGNTNVTVGAFEGERLRDQWRHETRCFSAPALLSAARKRRVRVTAAIYGSVVPELGGEVRKALRSFGVPSVGIGPRSALGMRLLVERPGQVGADRILNAVAAAELYGAPAVVVDFGTATTFDCISGRGDYLGGAILPGPNMAAQALAEKTAKLPLVQVRRPRRVIGRETVECIEAGLYYGYLGMIEKVLTLTKQELRQSGETGRVRAIATGGLSALFLRDLRGFIHAPDLTLQGLRLSYERLRRRGAAARGSFQ